MSRKGNIGKCALYPEDFLPGIISSDVLRIRPDDSRLSSLFLMCLLHNSSDVIHQIEMVGNGQIMKGINVTKLKSIVVYVPPLDLQKQFEAFIQQSDKSKLMIYYARFVALLLCWMRAARESTTSAMLISTHVKRISLRTHSS